MDAWIVKYSEHKISALKFNTSDATMCNQFELNRSMVVSDKFSRINCDR